MYLLFLCWGLCSILLLPGTPAGASKAIMKLFIMHHEVCLKDTFFSIYQVSPRAL